MEKILGQSPAAKNQDQNLNLNSDLYGAAVVSSIKNEASELNSEERSKENLILGGTQVSENCDSLLFFKDSPEKATTLLESAFKVMKTLFSPEKPRNKTSNSVNQHKSVLESSSNSFILSNKEKLIISEPHIGTPVMKSPLPEENDLKDKKQLPIPMLSSLSLDFQSNDDDSFLTTISYDESFKSAVTHFDENGEVTKTCDNLSHSVCNNSQDLDVAESCNSSLENSECFLENTMLKNDNASSKEISHNGFSIKTINENNEVFNGVKTIDHNDIEMPNPDCSYQASGIQIEVFKDNELDSSTQTSNKIINISDLNDEISAVNGVSKELDFHESEINSGGMVLKKENQIPDEITSQGFLQLVTVPQSTHCLSSNAECVKAAQKNKVIYTENIDWDFAEMENIETEKSILQNRSESPTPYLTKSDLNEVDEMLLALKCDSGTITSKNSFDKNSAVFNGVGGAACVLKSSDLTCGGEKSMKTKESTKPERPVSPYKSRSDKSREFLQNKITDKNVNKSDVFMEAQQSLVWSSKKEAEKLIESEMEDQNQLNLVDLSNLNLNHTNLNDNEGLNFEKNDVLSSIPQKNCIILCPNERSVVSPDHVPVNNSLYVTPLTVTNSEIQKSENENDSETTSLFVGEAEIMFSLKHSTPVSNLRSSSSVCSSNEKPNMNSLEISKESAGKINSELNIAKSDFLSKAMGIFFEPSNPSKFAESFSSVSLMSPKTPRELIRSPVTKCELSKSEKITQNLKKSKSPSPGRPNLVYETNHSKSQEENLEFFECDQTPDEKPGSFEIEKSDLNKTAKVRESVKLNRSKKLEVSRIANRTYDKMPDNGESNMLNLTFSKNVDTTSEKNKPLPLNEMTYTHDKESTQGKDSGCDFNDVNKILEKSLGFISDKERSGLSESQETDNFLSPIKEPPELMSQTVSLSANESLKENMDDNNKDYIYVNEEDHSFFSGSFSLSPCSGNSSLLKTQIAASNNQIVENLTVKLKEVHLAKEANKVFGQLQDEPKAADYETVNPAELNKNIEVDVAQLIKEQFTPNDIAKICDIATLSESLNNENLKAVENEPKTKVENVLSPKSFDFLNSIQGKPTGRDLSRESLYVKFDPLVQPSTANSLIDFTKEVEALAASETSPAHNSSSICEELLAISPEKKSDVIVPPLTPLSDRNKKDKIERQKELQNEIYFLKNLYSERERLNKAKMEEYESQISKLTGDKCVLDDKLKECTEREKSIVKKITSQTRDIEQLKVVMKEYVKVISVLSTELETTRKESAKEIESLNAEKESYMNHLLNTEAAFSDVHAKYEKSKRTIESLKLNEILYRNTISEHAQKMEEYKKKAKEAQEKAVSEFQHIMAELQESKNIHSQEVSRLRAQLKKTELKLEALQESLDQKIKENHQLTAICDELIEGKK